MPLGVLCLALTASTVQLCVDIITGCPISVGFNSVLDIQLYKKKKKDLKWSLPSGTIFTLQEIGLWNFY